MFCLVVSCCCTAFCLHSRSLLTRILVKEYMSLSLFCEKNVVPWWQHHFLPSHFSCWTLIWRGWLMIHVLCENCQWLSLVYVTTQQLVLNYEHASHNWVEEHLCSLKMLSSALASYSFDWYIMSNALEDSWQALIMMSSIILLEECSHVEYLASVDCYEALSERFSFPIWSVLEGFLFLCIMLKASPLGMPVALDFWEKTPHQAFSFACISFFC